MKKDELLFSALLLFLCLLIHAEALPASEKATPGGPVTIKADTLTYDQVNDTYQAEGNVIIYFTGGYLQADRVLLNRQTNEAFAEGNTYLKSNDDLLEGDRVDFNTETKTGIVQSGRIFFEKYHVYIRGKEIKKTAEADYFMKDGTATTCDGECPDWQLAAREMDVTIDGYGTMKDGTFQIREVPVLYFPYLIFPVKTTRQSGVLLPYLGYSDDKLGFDVEVPVFWAISENTDATFYQRYMDRRGYKQGAEFRYFLSPDTFGTFYADYLDDKWTGHTETGGIERNWTDSHNRWSYYLNHQSHFSRDFYIRTDINKVSDNFYFSDFSGHNYYLDHYGGRENRRFDRISYVGDKRLGSLDSKGRLVKDWGLFNATGLVQYTDNFADPSNDSTLQKYPEIVLTALKQPVFSSPLHFEMDAAYSYNYRDLGEKGNLLNAAPRLSMPIRFGDYLEFTPELGFRETYWDTTGALNGAGDKSGSRGIAAAGAKLSTDFFRVFDVGGASLDKIKHAVKPGIQYIYAPVVHDSTVPEFVAPLSDQHGITYFLENNLIARFKKPDGTPDYRDLLRVKLFQTYHIQEQENLDPGDITSVNEQGFGPFGAETEVWFNPYASYKSTIALDVHDGNWDRNDHLLRLADARGNAASVRYLYTRDTIEQINLLLRAKVTREIDVGYRLRQNLIEDASLESTYYIAFRRQCWEIEFAFSDEVDDKSVTVRLNLLGLSRPVRKTAMDEAQSELFW